MKGMSAMKMNNIKTFNDIDSAIKFITLLITDKRITTIKNAYKLDIVPYSDYRSKYQLKWYENLKV